MLSIYCDSVQEKKLKYDASNMDFSFGSVFFFNVLSLGEDMFIDFLLGGERD